MQTGEKTPKLSAKPSREEVQIVCDVLLGNGTRFKPIDVVHKKNHSSFATLLELRFATDPDRRDSCNNCKTWCNLLFCRELKLFFLPREEQVALIVVVLGSTTDKGSRLGARMTPVASACRIKKFVDTGSQHTNMIEGGAGER